MTVTRHYGHPNHQVMREFFAPNQAAGTAARMRPIQKIKLKGMYGVVTTAGTDNGCTAILRIGTTALGTATIGTATAGSQFSITGLDVEVGSQELVNTLTNHSLSADIAYAFQVDETNDVI